MSVFKGILKKISGGLKFGVVISPIILGVGGMISGAVCGGMSQSVRNNALEQFVNSNEFAIVKEEALDDLQIKYDNGEISFAQLIDQTEYYRSDDYVEKTIIQDNPDFQPYQAKLKTSERLSIAMIVGLAALGLGVVWGLVEMLSPLHEIILDSADFDFSEGSDEFEEARERRQKKREEKKDKKFSEKCEKIGVNEGMLSSDEEELKSINEIYYKE